MELWILIPLAALAVGAFEQWLKFRAKQEKLGTSTKQLEGVVEDLTERLQESEATRARLEQRIENLETIVTSVDWDKVTALRPEAPRLEIPEEPDASEEAERIARRVR
jgi:chromosome segregation ATPase